MIIKIIIQIIIGVLWYILARLIIKYVKYRQEKRIDKAFKNLQSQSYIDFSRDDIYVGGNSLKKAELSFQKSLKHPVKMKCGVCNREITKEQIVQKEIYICYMPEGLDIPNQYFHKRCANPNVLQYKNEDH